MMNCEQFRLDDRMERYVRGELGDDEQERFEEHFFECSDCFDALQTFRALHAELSDTDIEDLTPAGATKRLWEYPVAAAIAATLVGITFWWAAPQGPAVTPELMARLSTFEPPPHSAPVLRQPSNAAQSRFQDAMQFYSENDFSVAVMWLRQAAELDDTAANVSFFLGVTLLLTDNTEAGIEELSRTIALGDTPYLEEAYLYRARGFLKKADVQAARRDLETLIDLQGTQENRARELLDALDLD